MFQDDFASIAAEQAYDAPDLLSNPWFWLTAIAIGVMIAIFSWVGGQTRMRADVEGRRRGVCEAIWKAINDKARTAASAPRHQVAGAAQSLADEIRALLGPVVALAPLGGKAKTLLEALEGKPAKPGHGGAGHGEHGKGHGHSGHEQGAAHGAAAGHAGHDGHGPAQAEHGPEGDRHGGGAAAAHSAGSHIHINIGDRHHAAGNPPPAAHKPEPDKPHAPPRDSLDIDAIRAAVLAFTDYWSHRDSIVGQLQDAQIALLKHPPERGHAHGHGSGGAFKHGG